MTAHKAWIALVIAAIGSGITAALGFAAPDSSEFMVLTIIAAVLTPIATAFGVYEMPNKPKGDGNG